MQYISRRASDDTYNYSAYLATLGMVIDLIIAVVIVVVATVIAILVLFMIAIFAAEDVSSVDLLLSL